MNRAWLRSPDGIKFLNTIANDLAKRPEFSKALAGGGFASASTGNPTTDFNNAINDFLMGLGSIIGQSDLAQVDPAGVFRQALIDAYQMRFLDLYDLGLDVTLTQQQAETLGIITGNIYRAHKGDIGDYPKPDTSLTAPDVRHFHWARDVLGFWVCLRNNFDFGVPNPPPVVAVIQEFDNGCTLC
jgi:hypothetical protein